MWKDGLSPAQELFGHPVQLRQLTCPLSYVPSHVNGRSQQQMLIRQPGKGTKLPTRSQPIWASSWQSSRNTKPNIQTVGYLWYHYIRTTQAVLCQDTKRTNSSQKQTLLTQTKPNFNYNPCSKQTPHTLEPTTTIEPCRSSRVNYPSRLSQDPTWVLSSSVVPSEELGGDTIKYIPGVL